MCRNDGSCNYDMTMETYSCSCGDGFQGNTCETGEISFVCVGIFSPEFIIISSFVDPLLFDFVSDDLP